jgi:hypothetical protein
MKFIVVPILILLLLTQTFSKWAMIFQYEINKNYIARVLCENKSRPQLHCNGKCKLMEKMRADEEANTPVNNKPVKASLAEAFFLAEKFSLSVPVSISPSKVFNSSYVLKNYRSPHFPIFHPPSVS